MRLVQHIKKLCDRDKFNAHLSGERSMELRLDNFDVEEGDIITFVEVGQDGEKTGRTFTRKVVQVERSSSLDVTESELEKYGVAALALHAPEFNTLRLAFARRFLMGIVVECSSTSWRPWGNAQCWPLMVAPDLASTDILSQLRLHKWPDGVYTIHLMINYSQNEDEQSLVIDIDHAFVLAFCETTDGSIEGVEVELNSLMVGKAVGVFDGNLWTPSTPSQVRLYFQAGQPPRENSQLVFMNGDVGEDQMQEMVARTETSGETKWNNT